MRPTANNAPLVPLLYRNRAIPVVDKGVCALGIHARAAMSIRCVVRKMPRMAILYLICSYFCAIHFPSIVLTRSICFYHATHVALISKPRFAPGFFFFYVDPPVRKARITSLNFCPLSRRRLFGSKTTGGRVLASICFRRLPERRSSLSTW